MEYFNFEFVDKKYTADTFPMLHMAMSNVVPIQVRLTKYAEQDQNCET